MRILLMGENSQLRRSSQDAVAASFHELFAYGSSKLDISDAEPVTRIVADIKSEVTTLDIAEQDQAQACARYLVLHTAWAFSEYGNDFMKTMLRLAEESNAFSVVADQYGCPSYTGGLAMAILQLCDRYEASNELAWGVHYFCGDLPASWHGFARMACWQESYRNYLS